MQYIATIAKAIAAVVAVVIGAIAAGQIDVAPWVETLLVALAAALAVWATPNADAS